MKVYYDKNLETSIIRAHPWEIAAYDQGSKYYDFKQQPELISLVLEDFKPWSRYEAIQTFYEILRWINSEDSVLESNDSALAKISNNKDQYFQKDLQCAGRVMIFYRDLDLNVKEDFINWLMNATKFHLERVDSEFEWGAFGLAFMNTQFLNLSNQPVGKALQIHWWAFGNSEKETMGNMNSLFLGLKEALKCLSYEIQGNRNHRSGVT